MSGVPQWPAVCKSENRPVARLEASLETVTWLHRYGLAWEEGDPDATAALFTEDAVYRSAPFREPHIGRAAIREYAVNATADQTGTKVRFGTPIVDGNRVAVEWWATFDDGTLPGTLYLRFAPNGLCEELRETWNWADERLDPPEGWGT